MFPFLKRILRIHDQRNQTIGTFNVFFAQNMELPAVFHGSGDFAMRHMDADDRTVMAGT